MISLMFALIAGPAVVETQAVQAQLQSCALESGRYVCRYAVPDIVIVPVPGTDVVADAPAVVLGSGSAPTEAPSVEAIPPAPTATVTEPAAPPVAPPTAPATTAPTTTADAGSIRPIDAGVLTERESQLVARCADAGWMSLCLPDDRRAARTLRDKQNAYLAVRREVTRLLAADECEDAVKAALDGGYLALARETRDYCTPPTTTAASLGSAAAVPATQEEEAEVGGDPARAEADAGAAED